ncbi:MAG: FixH family protein [Bdellovibrionales bacterium]|nr:FixH family protein [Bdellovibrionales bacterium]
MKLFAIAIATAALTAFAPTTAKAHSYHTPQVCSATSADLCAHLGFKAEPNSTDATEFMLHFMPAASLDPKEIKNVTVTLWMDMGGHGHGSSPVTITMLDYIRYTVSDAYFVMQGEWQVKVGFDYLGTAHEIVIPVEVK